MVGEIALAELGSNYAMNRVERSDERIAERQPRERLGKRLSAGLAR
jgi:hypothetical protein